MKKMCGGKDGIRVVENNQLGRTMKPDVRNRNNNSAKYKTVSDIQQNHHSNYHISDKAVVDLTERYNRIYLGGNESENVLTDKSLDYPSEEQIVYHPVSTTTPVSNERLNTSSKSIDVQPPVVHSKQRTVTESKHESKSASSKRKKSPFSLFKRNPALRQRSHSINIVEQPTTNRSFSSDDYDPSQDKLMEPIVPKTKGPGSRTGSTYTDTSSSSTRSLTRHFQRRGSKGSSSSVTSLGEENIPRLVFIGDQRVGKTALITRFTRGIFSGQCKAMVSPIVKSTKFVYYGSIDKDVQVQFWNVDGGESQTAIDSCLKSHAVVVVYDITNRSSFQKAQYLLETINPRISALLIGNKMDLNGIRKVTYSEGRLLAKIHRVQYVETSCKDDFNVGEALQLLLATIPKEYMRRRNPKIQLRSKSETHMNISPMCNSCHRKLPKIPTLKQQQQKRHEEDEIEI